MNTQKEKLDQMYEDSEDQMNFEETYVEYFDYMDSVTKYFEEAGVDVDGHDLWEYFDEMRYPFEEFENGKIPPQGKIRYFGTEREVGYEPLFFLDINFGTLAEKVDVYIELDKFGIDFYPIFIIDSKTDRCLFVNNQPDEETSEIILKIKDHKFSEAERKILYKDARKNEYEDEKWERHFFGPEMDYIMDTAQDTIFFVSSKYRNRLVINEPYVVEI